jgi:hypothetical protein
LKTESQILRKRKLAAAQVDQTAQKNLSKKQKNLNAYVKITRVPSKVRTNIERLTLRFIVKGMHPLSTVDQQEFKDLIKGKR